jgi:hypothetical protein
MNSSRFLRTYVMLLPFFLNKLKFGVVQKRLILGNTGERNASTKAMEFQ